MKPEDLYKRAREIEEIWGESHLRIKALDDLLLTITKNIKLNCFVSLDPAIQASLNKFQNRDPSTLSHPDFLALLAAIERLGGTTSDKDRPNQQIQSGKPRRELVGVLDNLRSAHNVGSIFRSSECLGVSSLLLCGYTPTPDNPKVSKTSMGMESVVPWSQAVHCRDAIAALQDQEYEVIALEVAEGAKDLSETLIETGIGAKVALVVGNERHGLSQEVLELCDHQCRLPMRGVKNSLNVAVAYGIAVYALGV